MTTRPRSYQPKSCWCSLPTDLFERLLSILPIRDRWKVVPLVCQDWRHMHNSFLPKHKFLHLAKPVSQGMLHWIERVASTLEFLHVDNVRYVRPGGFVLKALQTIAKGSPGLDTLTLKLCNRMDGAAMVLNQIGAFSQIRKLTCEGLDFELKSRKVNFGVLANLGSLQEIEMKRFSWQQATVQQAKTLWNALAALPCLTSVKLHVDEKDGKTERSRDYLLISATKLVQIRSLIMEGLDTLLKDSLLPESFSTLTKLTHLEMRGVTTASVAPVTSLPALKSLTLWISERDLQPRNLGLQSTELTYLGISGLKVQSAGDLLPLASPSLQGLKSLAIMFGDLDDFPDPVASCLQQLTHLDLTGNFFTCIPSALSHITTLVILYMGGNQELELQRGDISLLHSLPDLEVLEVSKRLPENAGDESGFSQKSIGVLLEMAYTFPSLHLAGLDMNDQSDSDADHSDSD